MNTKKLFMLLAAVLLGSVSAMAQSGNNEPLKGDVNEDGTVDVADIVDVIKILKDAGGAVGEKMCYWYAGTEQVEADNFTDVASRIPESEIPETGSVTANGQYVYFVMPETKHVESLTYANGSVVEITCTDVMGYHIYKTTEMVNTTINYTIKQTTYYWYIGATDPSTMTSISPIIDDVNDTSSPGWRKIGTTLPTYGPSNKLWSGGSDGTDINMGSFRTSYLALPSNTIKVYSVGTDLTNDNYTMYNEPIEIDGVNYYIYTSKSNFKYFRFDLY